MKKTTSLVVALFVAINSLFSVTVVAKHPFLAQKETTFEEFVRLSPQEIQSKTGQKLTLIEQLGLKIIQRKIKKTLAHQPPECSKIVMKDGDVIEANVLQITPTEIKYKRCGKPNDPEIVINKKDVLSIKAADGEIIFRNLGNNNDNNGNNNNASNSNGNANKDNNYGTNSNNQNANNNEPKLQGNALAGMICGILGVLFLGTIVGLALGIVGIVLSISGRKKINNNPKQFKGKGMATAGLICGIVACGLFILALI